MKINHIAIAVADIDSAENFWSNVLGLPATKAYREEAQGVDVAFYQAGESSVELIAPINDTTGVAKFLQKRGPGMHHLCFEVDDIEQTLSELTKHGVQLIDETPRLNKKGIRVAFVHPKSTGGVLVEFYEIPHHSS